MCSKPRSDGGIILPGLLDDGYLGYCRQWQVGGESLSMLRWHQLEPEAESAIIVDDPEAGARIQSVRRDIAYIADPGGLSAVSLAQGVVRRLVSLSGIATTHHLLNGMLLIPVGSVLYVLDGNTVATAWEAKFVSPIKAVTMHQNQANLLSSDTI